MDKPGYYQGRHYTAYVIQVTALINEGHAAEAEQILLHLIDAIEAENAIDHSGAAPWYYKTLARIYHTQHNRAEEQAIIARFNRQPYGSTCLVCSASIPSARQLAHA